jgi:hypothetical protein
MKRNKTACLMLLALSTTAPVTVAQVTPTPGLGNTEIPEWLSQAMARETGPFESRPFELPQRDFSAELSGASLSPVQETSGGWYLSADIEAISPMECWIFTSPVDMAATLGNITELNLDASARANGEILDRTTYFADAGVVADAPFMSVETLYMMQAADEQRTGFAKVRIARIDDIHIACSHNQIGFRETFANNFANIVQSATFTRQPFQPFYREVYRQSIDGLGLGIIERSMAIDADGDLALTTVDSMIVPDTSSAATTTDTINFGFFRRGYELINLRTIGSVNGAVSFNVNFQPAGENVYRVIGTNGGDEIDFAVEDDVGHMSVPERMLAIQELIADPDRQSLTFRMWAPEAALGQLTETTIAFEGGSKEDLLATVTNGNTSTQVQLDEDGSYVDTEFAIEQGVFRVERVHKEGDAGPLADFR